MSLPGVNEPEVPTTHVRWKHSDIDQRHPIRADETHAWLISNTLPESTLRDLWPLLDEDERMRAARFRFESDHRRFVVRRGTLRKVLASYLETSPRAIRYSGNGRDKPCLLDSYNEDLRFNISSSGDWSMIAVSIAREVGIDVEKIAPDRADPSIVQNVFTPGEQALLARYGGDEWVRAFFNGWTRKEAFVKATGEGLHRALDSFEVSLSPGGPACLQSVLGSVRSAAAWEMTELEPIPRYAHALVVEGGIGALRAWQWSA